MIYYINNTNWINFLQHIIKEFDSYGLVPEDKNLFWKKLSAEDAEKIVVSKYRGVQPIKSCFFPAKEEVTNQPKDKKQLMIGAKACDLNHTKTTDKIFQEGALIDPYYTIRKQNTVIISSDCNEFCSSCFCTLMEEKPYSSKGFDLNVSPLRIGFIVETGSKKGEGLIESQKQFFKEPQKTQLEEREQLRKKITEQVEENNKEFSWKNPREVVEKHPESKKWKEEVAKTCVECDACRFVCGSCYCFLLSETEKQWERLRTWDSCQSTGYARVAGGANPRKTRDERLRNFYMCKLSYRPENYGFYACVGCGRCIDVCQGKIDIRKSLQKLSKGK